MKNIIESLQWRYATKKFDPTKKLTPAQLDMLLKAVRLSPSSCGRNYAKPPGASCRSPTLRHSLFSASEKISTTLSLTPTCSPLPRPAMCRSKRSKVSLIPSKAPSNPVPLPKPSVNGLPAKSISLSAFFSPQPLIST